MDKQQRYEATEKGKEARARAQATRQAKRKELAEVRFVHEMRRRAFGSAKFSKQYTVYSTRATKHMDKGKLAEVNGTIGKGTKGVDVGSFGRVYWSSESETPQCVQGGVPRWSESILNPTYVKKLNEEENLILRVRKVLARIHKLLGRKSNQEKP